MLIAIVVVVVGGGGGGGSCCLPAPLLFSVIGFPSFSFLRLFLFSIPGGGGGGGNLRPIVCKWLY